MTFHSSIYTAGWTGDQMDTEAGATKEGSDYGWGMDAEISITKFSENISKFDLTKLGSKICI